MVALRCNIALPAQRGSDQCDDEKNRIVVELVSALTHLPGRAKDNANRLGVLIDKVTRAKAILKSSRFEFEPLDLLPP
jgi:hypothetical protein